MAKKRGVCAWTPIATVGGGKLYRTACGFGAEKAFEYCPYCGGLLVLEKGEEKEQQSTLPLK